MELLAIDPGNTESAYVVLRDGVPVLFKTVDNETMLRFIPGVYHDHLAIEMIASYGMAVGREVFETCVWIGRFIGATALPHTQVYRKDVKLHLCGSPRAKDPNVRQALIDRFGGESEAIGGVKCPFCKGKGWAGRGRKTCPECCGGTWKRPPGPLHGMSGDCWAALAVGITYLETCRDAAGA